VELYKHAKGISGREAFDFLYKTGAADYIADCADALHMTGHLYIVESIDDNIGLTCAKGKRFRKFSLKFY
jgi:hypothetical protein